MDKIKLKQLELALLETKQQNKELQTQLSRYKQQNKELQSLLTRALTIAKMGNKS